MTRKEKAAARGGSSGRKAFDNETRAPYRKPAKTATFPGETVVYDGLDYRGRVLPWRGQYQARDERDHLIDTLPTAAAAAAAVYAAGGAG